MGIVIDFVERQKRSKVCKLLKEAEETMDKFKSYRHLSLNREETQEALACQKKYLALIEEVRVLAEELKAPYSFVTKYTSLSRGRFTNKLTGQTGTLTGVFRHAWPNPYLLDPAAPKE